MAVLTVTFWAGAARAAGHRSEGLEASTLDDLRCTLAKRPALTGVMASASLLVDGRGQPGDAPLADGSTVDVLPPFAGG